MGNMRPFKPHERQHLSSYTPAALNAEIFRIFIFSVPFLAGILFLGTYGSWALMANIGFSVAHPAAYKSWFIIAALGIAMPIVLYQLGRYWRSLQTPAQQAFISKIKADLKTGQAKVETFTVIEAIELQQVEDEGAGFLLGLDDGRVLYVIGQDLYDYAHDTPESERSNTFPSTIVEYVSAPQSGLRLGIAGTGSPLLPLGLYDEPAIRKGGFRTYALEDGRFYPGPLQDVIDHFHLVPVSDRQKSG